MSRIRWKPKCRTCGQKYPELAKKETLPKCLAQVEDPETGEKRECGSENIAFRLVTTKRRYKTIPIELGSRRFEVAFTSGNLAACDIYELTLVPINPAKAKRIARAALRKRSGLGGTLSAEKKKEIQRDAHALTRSVRRKVDSMATRRAVLGKLKTEHPEMIA